MRNVLLLLGVISVSACADRRFAGDYTNASLAGELSLTDRVLSIPGTPATEQQLPSLDHSFATTLGDFQITYLDGGYESATVHTATVGYGGYFAIPRGSLDGEPDGFTDFDIALQIPPSEPAKPTAAAHITTQARGTATLRDRTLQIVVVGDVYRMFTGTVGEDFPDGLFEHGTASYTLTATQRCALRRGRTA